jgi:hypothetical protein
VAHVRAAVSGFASDMADKAAGHTRAARPGRSGAVPAEYLIDGYRRTIAEYERIGQPDSPFAVTSRMRLAVLEARQRAGAAQNRSGDTERQSSGQRANLSLDAGNARSNPQTTA